MNSYSKIPKENIIQAAANSSSKNTAAALVDNRTASLAKETSLKQLKSNQIVVGSKSDNTIQRYEEKEEEHVHENNENKPDTSLVQLMKIKSNNATTSISNGNVIQLIPGITFTQAQRTRLLARNKNRNGGFHCCEHCGFRHSQVNYALYRGRRIGDGGFQIDHILHASRGGRNLIRNGRVLCGTCNTSRGNRANVGRTGITKYRGLHGKKVIKNYLRKPR
jgi:5-methylcytosine-specific restriction endonuclease McrA